VHINKEHSILDKAFTTAFFNKWWEQVYWTLQGSTKSQCWCLVCNAVYAGLTHQHILYTVN